MLTVEKVRRHFTGPTEKRNSEFWWHQKGRHYPRVSYMLFFNPYSRRFFLHKSMIHTARMRIGQRSLVENDQMIEAFRLALPTDAIARCTARALAAPAAPTWAHLGADSIRTGRWP